MKGLTKAGKETLRDIGIFILLLVVIGLFVKDDVARTIALAFVFGLFMNRIIDRITGENTHRDIFEKLGAIEKRFDALEAKLGVVEKKKKELNPKQRSEFEMGAGIVVKDFLRAELPKLILEGIIIVIVFGLLYTFAIKPIFDPRTDIQVSLSDPKNTDYYILEFKNNANFAGKNFNILIFNIVSHEMEMIPPINQMCNFSKYGDALGNSIECSLLPPNTILKFNLKKLEGGDFYFYYWSDNTPLTKMKCTINPLDCKEVGVYT